MEIRYNSPSPSELYHHGILGQKWGVRRYQNKDGSLTDAGRKRYLSDTVNEELKTYGSTIQQLSDDAANYANEYAKKIEEKTKKLSNDEKFRKKVFDKIDRYYGDHINDRAFSDGFDYEKDEYINEVVEDYIKNDKELASLKQQYDKTQETYWNTIETVTNNTIKKLGADFINELNNNSYITTGEGAVKAFVNSNIPSTAYTSYMYKHFDDYWYSEAIDPKVYEITWYEYLDYKKKKN